MQRVVKEQRRLKTLALISPDRMQTKPPQLHGIFSSKFVVSREGLFDSPMDARTMMADTSLDQFAMNSRDRRNQRTLNSIKDSEKQMHAQLRMLRRDITNNVLEQHRNSGSNAKMKTKVTVRELVGVEEALLDMDEKLDKLQENKFWNKTSVKEQA